MASIYHERSDGGKIHVSVHLLGRGLHIKVLNDVYINCWYSIVSTIDIPLSPKNLKNLDTLYTFENS